MFGIGKSLTAAQRRAAQKAGEKVAKGIIKAVTISKKARPKTGYKHRSWRPK